ncbi:hypothetical protein [Paenibacillus sp. UMB4589-SE434]|uniref:hypothetical protein n=1 Tax=Paenibacillus sp. UMB4589-SE434 TaxID=3046314 RepID=UPI00254E964B|nr:hypothetical protein [Paenibacillus sp. UMB4589-SE434]MDK8183409.1 hypothetical protein [Paenibacillus sp. UMB4589-SE434]
MKKVKLIVLIIPTLIIISIILLMILNKDDFNSIRGIINLHFSKDNIVEFTGPPNSIYYISRSKENDEPIIQLMKQKGFLQTDHQGASYFFEDGKVKKIITKKIYAKNYLIWKIDSN